MVQRFWSKLGFKLWTWLAWLITFNFVNIAWVFFRAKEWNDAIKVLKGMVGLEEIGKFTFFLFGISKYDSLLVCFIFFISIFIVFFTKNSIEQLQEYRPSKRNQFLIGFCLSFGIVGLSRTSDFLYFNF